MNLVTVVKAVNKSPLAQKLLYPPNVTLLLRFGDKTYTVDPTRVKPYGLRINVYNQVQLRPETIKKRTTCFNEVAFKL